LANHASATGSFFSPEQVGEPSLGHIRLTNQRNGDNPVILNIHHNAFLKGLLIQTGRKTANAYVRKIKPK
jgi:hypothetical protein